MYKPQTESHCIYSFISLKHSKISYKFLGMFQFLKVCIITFFNNIIFYKIVGYWSVRKPRFSLHACSCRVVDWSGQFSVLKNVVNGGLKDSSTLGWMLDILCFSLHRLVGLSKYSLVSSIVTWKMSCPRHAQRKLLS